jgi:glycosyltransferase involved in cell wall biosynthesis
MSETATEQPLVSIALCVYNGERYLREQLDSILAQEGVRLEIVAVDDCSTDGSLALLQEYAARVPRMRVFENEANLGHLQSFDKAMALCDGPFIAPSDQDDIWEPSKLRRLYDALGDADLAYCDSAYIDGDGTPLGGSVAHDLGEMHAGHDAVPFLFQNTASGHALLLRREVFDLARPFPELLYHDWWLALKAADRRGVVYVDAPLVRFRRHATACSPLGKDADTGLAAERRLRKAASQDSRNRKWLEQLLYVTGAVATTDWMVATTARQWHVALRAATDRDFAPLRNVIWQCRDSVPPWSGPRWMRALRCYTRCRRKVKRARDEPMPSTPLFSD